MQPEESPTISTPPTGTPATKENPSSNLAVAVEGVVRGFLPASYLIAVWTVTDASNGVAGAMTLKNDISVSDKFPRADFNESVRLFQQSLANLGREAK